MLTTTAEGTNGDVALELQTAQHSVRVPGCPDTGQPAWTCSHHAAQSKAPAWPASRRFCFPQVLLL